MPLPALAVPLFASKALKAVGGFFSKITLRQWLYFAAFIAILFCTYKTYSWVFDRGAHSRDTEVAQLKADLEAERGKIAKWTADTKLANEKFALEQAGLRKNLQVQLDAANLKASQRKVEIREVTKYISAADDAACRIPVAVDSLFNYAAEGTPPGALDQLSDPAPGVQATASTTTLSQLTVVATNNTSEAVRRGAVIHQWEQWYDASKEQFTRAQQSAAEAILAGTPREDKPEPE